MKHFAVLMLHCAFWLIYSAGWWVDGRKLACENARMKLCENFNRALARTLERKGKQWKVVFVDISTNAKSQPFASSIFEVGNLDQKCIRKGELMWEWHSYTSEEQRKINDIKSKIYYTMTGRRGGCLMDISLIIGFILRNAHPIVHICKNILCLNLSTVAFWFLSSTPIRYQHLLSLNGSSREVL